MSVTTLAHCWFVGIDLHKDTLTACVYCTCCGEIRFQKLSCKCRKQIAEFFGGLPRPHVVAIEAVGFYRWLWEMLEPLVDKLVLADATQARALAGRRMKTDREDAQNIAELLACGRLPVAYAPPFEVQVLRDCSRQRNALSRQHAHVLHRAKSVMNANNRPGPARMDSAALIRYLKAFEHKLPERHGRYLWQCVDQLVLIERQLSHLEIELERLLRSAQLCVHGRDSQQFPWCGPGDLRDGAGRDRRLQPLHLPQGHLALRRLRPTHVRLGRQAAERDISRNAVPAICAGCWARPLGAPSASIRRSNASGCGSVASPARKSRLWRSHVGCCCGCGAPSAPVNHIDRRLSRRNKQTHSKGNHGIDRSLSVLGQGLNGRELVSENGRRSHRIRFPGPRTSLLELE